MASDLDHINQQLRDIKKALEGNGRPGLVQDATELSVRVRQLESCVDEMKGKAETQTRLTISALGAVGLTVLGAILEFVLRK